MQLALPVAYGLTSLIHPGLARRVILKPIFLDFAKSLGTSAPVVLPAAQIVVMSVSSLVDHQPAMLMVTAIGQTNLLELQPWVLRGLVHVPILLGALVLLLKVGGVRREKVLETLVRWEVGL